MEKGRESRLGWIIYEPWCLPTTSRALYPDLWMKREQVPLGRRRERTFSSSRNKYGPFRLQISFSHLVHITYRCFIFLDAFAVSEKITARSRAMENLVFLMAGLSGWYRCTGRRKQVCQDAGTTPSLHVSQVSAHQYHHYQTSLMA